MSRRFPRTFLLVPLLAVVMGATPEATPAKTPPFIIGEKLVYEARIWKGIRLLGFSVGRSILEVRASDRPEFPDAYNFHAKAEGGALGYSVTATIDSYLDDETLRPLWVDLKQTGSEFYHKQMRFEGDEALYVKRKHCKAWKTCTHPDHMINRRKSRGWFQGSDWVREHCRDKDCGNRKHNVWETRDRHKLEKPAYDMLSVVYLCRNMDLDVGGKGETVRIVNAHDLWDVNVRAVKKETVRVDGGRFQALLIEINPAPAKDDTKLRDEFQGLFGIKGNIQLWIDEKTRIPVKIRGIVPFGVDLNMEIDLVRKRIPESPRS